MRIAHLILERFGLFTDRALPFRADARLHLIFGPNEAGKSTTLAAVTDLLFGIPHLTLHDFIHQPTEMRLGATLIDRDGQPFRFKRRKGRKETLLAEDGKTPLEESALNRFLGGIGRDDFLRIFGLTADSLRRGADDMLKSGGETGQTLFAASSGLHKVPDLRRTLTEQASDIFTEKGRVKPRLTRLLNSFDEEYAALDSSIETDTKVKRRDKELNETSERAQANDQALHELRARQRRLSRGLAAAPTLRRLLEGEAELARLADLPAAEPGFAADLHRALDQLARRGEASERTQATLTAARTALGEINVDTAVLDQASAILTLFKKSGEIEKSRADCQRVEAQRAGVDLHLDELVLRLGLARREDIAHPPADAEIADLRRLIEQGRDLDKQQAKDADELARDRDDLEHARHALKLHGAVHNPAAWKERFVPLEPALTRLAARGRAAQGLAELTRRLEEDAARLSPAVLDFARLASTALPGAESVARFDAADKRLAEETRHADGQLAAHRQALAKTEADLVGLTDGAIIATAETVTAARSERDAMWARVRNHLLGAARLSGSDLADSLLRFTELGGRADQLADARASQADRAAQLAQLQQKRLDSERQTALWIERLDRLTDRRAAWTEQWRELWHQTGITPLGPAEMAAWLRRLDELFARRAEQIRLEAELTGLSDEATALRPTLAALAQDLGLSATDQPVEQLGRAVAARLESLQESWASARSLTQSIADQEQRIARRLAAAARTAQDRTAWESAWRAALGEVGLAPGSSLTAAEATLNAWSKVPERLRERHDFAARVTGMQRDIQQFEAEARRLGALLAADLDPTQPEQLAAALNRRLSEAQAAATRQREADKALRKAQADHERALAETQTAQLELDRLTRQAPPCADLPGLCRQLAQRDAVQQELAKARADFAAQADGLDEARLRVELADFDPDLARAELQALEDSERALVREGQELFAARQELEKAQAALAQSHTAEQSAQRLQGLEADIAAEGRDWLRLRLAELLLRKIVERQRAEQHGPLLSRAGALFTILTGAAFAGIEEIYGDDDELHLVAVRAGSGKKLAPAELSEGTCDQLYLALRLAFVEAHAEKSGNEPIPFIGDDLFASFDDERAGHGLAALADLGGQVQPILFTHHRHLVDLARQRLGNAVDVIDLQSPEALLRSD